MAKLTLIQRAELRAEIKYEMAEYKQRYRVALSQEFVSAFHRLNLWKLQSLLYNLEDYQLLKWFESFSGYRASNQA